MMRTVGACLAWLAVAIGAGCQKESLAPVDVTAPAGTDEVRAVIGSEGGKLRFPEGAVLEVPPAVLMEEVSFSFRRAEPVLDLPGKDVLDRAYAIAPKVDFAPGAAVLSVPVNRELPGTVDELKLGLFCFGRKVSTSPQGELSQETWFPCPQAVFKGRSQGGKFLDFALSSTTANRSDKLPFGFVQVAFEAKSGQ